MARCKLGRLIYTVGGPDAVLLERWTDTGLDGQLRPVSAEAMTKALHADKHNVGVHTVRKHRAHTCVCVKP